MGAQKFRVWAADTAESLDDWTQALQHWPKAEVFADPLYVRLYEDSSCRAHCASLQSDDGTVLFPFLLRSIPDESGPDDRKARCFDIVTPYGYGGPFFWDSQDSKALAKRFWTLFDEWAKSADVVSEFIRFSLFGDSILPYPGTTEFKQDNVVRLLDLPEDDMWMDFEHKVRKNVKKATRSGLEIVTDLNGERFEDFFQIYVDTMDRREAGEGYYFTREYFKSIHRDLAGKFVYFHALLDGQVISTELVLLSKDSAYSFLGGTSSDAFSMRPNDLLKFEIMRWCQSSGRSNYVLGGGFEAEDGIFRYKLAFAPHGRRPFSIGFRIHDDLRYEELVNSKAALNERWQPAEGYFPVYRG